MLNLEELLIKAALYRHRKTQLLPTDSSEGEPNREECATRKTFEWHYVVIYFILILSKQTLAKTQQCACLPA